MMSVLLQFVLLAVFAQADVPKECHNVAAFEASLIKFSVPSKHLKNCITEVKGLRAIFADMMAKKAKAVETARAEAGDSQSGALSDTAALAGAGAATKGNWSKIAMNAQKKFDSVAARIGEQIALLDKDSAKVTGSVSGGEKDIFISRSSSAREDLVGLKNTAVGFSEEAVRVSGDFHDEAGDLSRYAKGNRATAERLNGGKNSGGEGVSKNLLIGLGGAAVISAGVVGGLYWVSQKAVKSADDAAANRINQAQTAANQVVANAEAAANRVIKFATDSLNGVIANAAEAANKIYDRAKSDLEKLKADLAGELQSAFANLTDVGLQKLKTELQGMFTGIIARAKAEGNQKLADDLQKILDGLNGQIGSELSRRAGSGAAVTPPSSPVSSVSATATATGTATATVSSTATSTSGYHRE